MPEEKLNGTKIYYQVHGKDDAYPLVLTHGLGSDHTMWHNQVPVFKEKYRLVLWDVRGHGRSEVTEDGYSIDRFADDLKALLDHLRIKCAHIGGLSMGGWISFTFALKYPKSTAALILSNSGGIRSGMTKEQMADKRKLFLISAQIAEKAGRAQLVDSTLSFMFTPQFIENNPEAVELTKKRILADPGIGYARTIRGILIDYWDVDAEDMLKKVSGISAPALVIGGEFDLLTPAPTQVALHKSIPGSRYELIKGAAHVTPIEKPDLWNELVLDFLDGIQA
jgi:3-oxoadipate enol-lactonase